LVLPLFTPRLGARNGYDRTHGEAMARSHAVMALLFVIPATIAGYHAALGLAHFGVPCQGWRGVFAVSGAVFVGGTAWARMFQLGPVAAARPAPSRSCGQRRRMSMKASRLVIRRGRSFDRLSRASGAERNGSGRVRWFTLSLTQISRACL
jgi:hypothetical protein